MRHPLAVLVVLASCVGLVACDSKRVGPDPAAGPRVSIASPRMDQVLADEHVTVMLDLQNYAIGKVEDGGNGQHLHLIVDNEPYQAIYDVRTGIPLDPKWMTPGTHVLRAFPSAGPKDDKGALHHESRKSPGAFAWVRFHVKEKGGPLDGFDGGKPLLTYSRPKGEYKVGAPELKRFMVDFYVTNVTLEKGRAAVRATLDGTVLGEWTEWKPYVLETPPAVGDHKLVLELVDGDGRAVDGPLNRTERKFKVSER